MTGTEGPSRRFGSGQHGEGSREVNRDLLIGTQDTSPGQETENHDNTRVYMTRRQACVS